MPMRTVLFDTYAWMEPGEGGRYEHRTAHRGETIDVSEAEVARGEAAGALGTPEDLAAADYAAGLWSDDQLVYASTEELRAYVAERPAERARVLGLDFVRPGIARDLEGRP